MRTTRVLLFGALTLAGFCFATAAYAEDPPAPAVEAAPQGPPPLPGADRPAPPPPSGSVVVGPSAPAPAWGATDPCAPPCPAPGPTPCAPCPCYQLRDAAGWPVDANQCRLGRLELTGHATYSLIPDPEHAFGLDTFFPNQLRWSSLDYDGEFGGRGAIRYHLTPCDSVELRGGYLGNFEDQKRLTGVFGYGPAGPVPLIPGPAPGVAGPFTADFTMEATLWTGELNWWSEQICDGRWRLDTVVGARVINYEEDADARNFAPPFPFGGASFVRSETDNLFIGLQAGGQAHWDLNQCFELNGSLKWMVGNLNHESTVTDASIFAGGPHTATREEDEITWGLEAEVGARWRICRWLYLEGGYSLLFLDAVQRANDALFFGASPSGAVQAQDLTDQLLTHTFFAGLTLRF